MDERARNSCAHGRSVHNDADTNDCNNCSFDDGAADSCAHRATVNHRGPAIFHSARRSQRVDAA